MVEAKHARPRPVGPPDRSAQATPLHKRGGKCLAQPGAERVERANALYKYYSVLSQIVVPVMAASPTTHPTTPVRKE